MRCVVLISAIFAAGVLGAEINPSQIEASFVGGVSSLPQLIAQEQFERRLADTILGLSVASNFLQYGQVEYQLLKREGPVATAAEMEEEESENNDRALEQDSEDQELEESEDDLNLLQLKEEFYPFMGVGAQQPQSELSTDQLVLYRHIAKTTALKGLHLQLYLSAHDVQRSYWTNKIVTAILPSQLAMIKLYKMYLNTLALTLAFQLHDAYTLEAFMEHFNAEYDPSQVSGSAVTIENVAESTLFGNWQMLAMIKFQLFAINMYESYIGSYITQAATQAPPQNNNANAFVEVDSQFVGGNQNAFLMQYAYLSYFVMILKYYGVYIEMSLASTGAMTAGLKIKAATDSDEQTATTLKHLSSEVLPSLFTQWASINQYKYMMEYWLVMLDMYTPQFAGMRAADRAENTFTNLVQTEPAELSTTTPAVEEHKK